MGGWTLPLGIWHNRDGVRHFSSFDSRCFFPLLLVRSRLALVGRPGLAPPELAWFCRPAGRLAGLLGLVGLVGLATLMSAVGPPALRAEAQAPIQIVGTRCLTNDDEVITIQNLGNQSLSLAG